MKSLIFSLTIIILTITSCQTANFGNFNKKKFTNLKPMQSSYVDQDVAVEDKQTLSFDDKAQITNSNFKEDLDRLTENNPTVLAIQKALEAGDKLIVNIDDNYYEVKNPFYDGISRNVIGELVEIENHTEYDHLELAVNDYRTNPNGLSEISVNDVSFFIARLGFKKEVDESIEKDNPTSEDLEKTEINKTPVKQEPTQQMIANKAKNDLHIEISRKTFFTGLGFVGLMFVFTAVAILTSIFWFLIPVAAAFLIAYILMCCTLWHYNRAKRWSKKDRRIRNAARVLFILGTVVWGILLLIAGVVLLFSFGY